MNVIRGLLIICFLPTLSDAQTSDDSSLIELLTPDFVTPNEVGALLFPVPLLQSETPIATRVGLLYGVALHEAAAACHPTGLSFLGEREPIAERFCSSRLSRLLIERQLSYRLWISEFPIDGEPYGRFLDRLGLEPYDITTNRSIERGWANAVANKLVRYFAADGWNSQGDLSKSNYLLEYQDFTGYKPVNPGFLAPNKLIRPLRWQPLTRPSDFRGKFETQVHVTPHIGLTAKPLAISRAQMEERVAPPLYNTPNRRRRLGRHDTKLALTLIEKLFNTSRQVTLEDVLVSYWWNDKFASLGIIFGLYLRIYGLDRLALIQVFLGDMIAQYDAVLVAWKEKRRYDYVRPPTLIRKLLAGKNVTAFRGIGKGVGEVKAEEWEPVLPIQPHSEYPSASAVICTAALEALEAYLKEVVLKDGEAVAPFSFNIQRSRGFFLPVGANVTVTFESLEEAILSCGRSRLTSGVHFEPSVPAGHALGRGIGVIAFRHVRDLYDGKIPENCERCRSSTKFSKE